jgi:CHAT domain-containing protein
LLDLLRASAAPSKTTSRPAVKSVSQERNEPRGEIRQVLIVPDGALHQLPFESLLLPKEMVGPDGNIPYVVDRLPAIRYGPSLSVLARITEPHGTTTDTGPSLLTVGNPEYPAKDRQSALPAWKELFRQIPSQQGAFVPLAFSEDECQSVFDSFKEMRRVKLVRADATEAAVRKHIQTSRFVHIAAHGCVDYQNDNLLGALVFKPGNGSDPRDDGLLQLGEIYELNLSRCDLAVLSACNTYRGSERPLEAGMSIARAFLEQDAKRVVCSQWSIDDQTSSKLIGQFFHAIGAERRTGKAVDYAQALHEAMRSVHQNDRSLGPKKWAPFVLVGAP